MSTQQRQKTIGEAYAVPITPGHRLAGYIVLESRRKEPEALQEEWEDRLRSLEQWICELLIKNQQLRTDLGSTTAPEEQKRDD